MTNIHDGRRTRRWSAALGITAATGLVALGAVLPGLPGAADPGPPVLASAQVTAAPTDAIGSDSDADESAATGFTPTDDLINAELLPISVQVVSQDLDDTDLEYLQFGFARPIIEIGSETGFTLSGLNRDARVDSVSAELVNGDPSAVLVGFAAGTDVRAFTLASVAAGVAVGETGSLNVPLSLPLTDGPTVGGADVPTLVSVIPNDTLDQVVYRFDRNLDENDSTVDPTRLGLYTVDGRQIPGESVVTVDDESVTIGFAAQVEDGVRHYAEVGGVVDARGVGNVASSVGDTTTAPDLVGVSGLVGRTQFDYTFDQPISQADASRFVVYTPNGAPIEGSSVVLPAGDVVRVAFPEIQEFGAEVTLAAVEQGAVTSNDGFGTENTLGTRALGAASGATSGPDLVSLSADLVAGQLRYTFDEAIDEDLSYDPSTFALINGAGDVFVGESVIEVDGDSVLVAFSPNALRSALGSTIAEGAVSDHQGEPSTVGTLLL